jgi:spore coat protein U-like protein
MHEFRIRRGTAVALAIGLATALNVAKDANADNHTATLSVETFIAESCTIAVITHLDFGEYDPNTNTDSSATFQVTCPNQENINVEMNAGENSFSGQRRVKHEDVNEFLIYALTHSDGSPWDFNSPKEVPTNTPVTISGVLFAMGANGFPAGTYEDSVLITVTP